MAVPSPSPTAGPSAAADRTRNGVLALVVGERSGPAATLRLLGRPLASHALGALRLVPGIDVGVVGGRGRRDEGAVSLAPEQPWRPWARTGLILHDALCPLLPWQTIQHCIERAGEDSAVIGLRPVTDTIKQVCDGMVVGTENRDHLAALASPVVIGRKLLDGVAEAFPTPADLADLGRVVDRVAELGRVRSVEVPSMARRLSDLDDIALLECLHELRRTLREH